MKKPNAEVFAEHVLWYLCGIQAHLRELDARTATDLALRTGVPLEQIVLDSKKRREALRDELFADSIHLCKLGKVPESPEQSQRDMPPDPRA